MFLIIFSTTFRMLSLMTNHIHIIVLMLLLHYNITKATYFFGEAPLVSGGLLYVN